MPIIFIPGIKASKLVDTYPTDNIVRWSLEDNMFGDLFENPFDFQLAQGRHDTGLRFFREWEVIAYPYGRLIDHLRREVDAHTYIFTYDWRKSVAQNAYKLVEFIESVLGKVRAAGQPEAKVNFVTHSLGGLLLRSALGLRRPNFFGDIGRIVFIAPPFKGSGDIPRALIVGERNGWLSNEEDGRKIARTFPSVYELIPTFRGIAVAADDGRALDLFDFENWQANVTHAAHRRSDKLQPELLANAEALRRGRRARHGGASSAPLLTDAQLRRHSADVAILMSVGYKTVTQIPIVTNNPRNPNWFDFDNQSVDRNGDLRIHLKSAAVRGITLAAYRGLRSHALVCRENIVIKSVAAWLQGKRMLRMRPRTARHSVGRSGRKYFEQWDGRERSFEDHIQPA